MSRVDQLPEEALEEAIRQLEKDVEQIKGIQFMGADVLVPKVNVTGSTYDIDSALSFGNQVVSSTVLFTADHQPDVYATLVPKFYDGSGNELDQSDFVSINVFRGDHTAYGHTDLSLELPGTFKSVIHIDATSASAFHVKLYVLATDTGSITLI